MQRALALRLFCVNTLGKDFEWRRRMRFFSLLAIVMSLSLAACGREPGPRVILDRKGRLDLRVRKAFKVWRGPKGSGGRKDHRVRRVHQVIPARLAFARCKRTGQ
jgi:hypothetical protein